MPSQSLECCKTLRITELQPQTTQKPKHYRKKNFSTEKNEMKLKPALWVFYAV